MDSALSPGSVKRRRRSVAVAALAAAGAATIGSFVLGSTGITSTSVAPPDGLDDTGAVAEVFSMSSTVSRMIGGATKETGKTIGKVLVARDYTRDVRVSIAWLNPLEADKVLNNPNVQLQISLYYPTSTTTGTCSNPDALAVVDGDTTFCALRDGTATGSYSVTDGELFLAPTIQSGFLRPSVDGGGALAACGADTGSPTSWCQPAVAYAAAAQRLLYVVGAITVPGGVPKGQQNQLGALEFFLRASRAA